MQESELNILPDRTFELSHHIWPMVPYGHTCIEHMAPYAQYRCDHKGSFIYLSLYLRKSTKTLDTNSLIYIVYISDPQQNIVELLDTQI